MLIDRLKVATFVGFIIISGCVGRKLYDSQSEEDDSLDCSDGRKIDDPVLLPFVQKLRGQEMIPAKMKNWVIVFDSSQRDTHGFFREENAWNHTYLTDSGLSNNDQGEIYGHVYFTEWTNVYLPRMTPLSDDMAEYRIMYAEQLLIDAMETVRVLVLYDEESDRNANVSKSSERLLQVLLNRMQRKAVTVHAESCPNECIRKSENPFAVMATCGFVYRWNVTAECAGGMEAITEELLTNATSSPVVKSSFPEYQVDLPLQLKQKLHKILDWILKRIGQRMSNYMDMAFAKNKFRKNPMDIYNKVNLQISKIKGGKTFEASKSAELIYNSLFDLNVYLNVTNTPYTFDKFHSFHLYLDFIGRFSKWQLDTTKYANFFEPLKDLCTAFINKGNLLAKPAEKIFELEDGVYDLFGSICHNATLYIVDGVVTVTVIKSALYDSANCQFDTVFVLAKKNITINEGLKIPGKNLVVYSPSWIINRQQVIDLSGEDGRFDEDNLPLAGQDGGDFYGFGVKFEKNDLLTVISNGGKGSDGRIAPKVVEDEGECEMDDEGTAHKTYWAIYGSTLGGPGGFPGTVTVKIIKTPVDNLTVIADFGKSGTNGTLRGMTVTCGDGRETAVPAMALAEVNPPRNSVNKMDESEIMGTFSKVIRRNSRRLSYDVLSFYKDIWTSPMMARTLDTTLRDFLTAEDFSRDSKEYYEITSQILHSLIRQNCNMTDTQKILLDFVLATIRMKTPPEGYLPSVINPEDYIKEVAMAIGKEDMQTNYFETQEKKFLRVIEEANSYLKDSLLPTLTQSMQDVHEYLDLNFHDAMTGGTGAEVDAVHDHLVVNNLLRYLRQVFQHVQESLNDFVVKDEEGDGGRDREETEEKLYFFRNIRNNITEAEMDALTEFLRLMRKVVDEGDAVHARNECDGCKNDVSELITQYRHLLTEGETGCSVCVGNMKELLKELEMVMGGRGGKIRHRRQDDSDNKRYIVGKMCNSCKDTCPNCIWCGACWGYCPYCNNCNYCPWCSKCQPVVDPCKNCYDCNKCPNCPQCQPPPCHICNDCSKCPNCPQCKPPDCNTCNDCSKCPNCPQCKPPDCNTCKDCSKCPNCPQCKAPDCNTCKDCSKCPNCPQCKAPDCNTCKDCSKCPNCPQCKAPDCNTCKDCSKCPNCPQCKAPDCKTCKDCSKCPNCPQCKAPDCKTCKDCSKCPKCPQCKPPDCNTCKDCSKCPNCPQCQPLFCIICKNCSKCPNCPQCKHHDCETCKDCSECPKCPQCEIPPDTVCDSCRDCKLCRRCPKCSGGEMDEPGCGTCPSCSWCPHCRICQKPPGLYCHICTNCHKCPNCPQCTQEVIEPSTCDFCSSCERCPNCPICKKYPGRYCQYCPDCTICPNCLKCIKTKSNAISCKFCDDCSFCPDCSKCKKKFLPGYGSYKPGHLWRNQQHNGLPRGHTFRSSRSPKNSFSSGDEESDRSQRLEIAQRIRRLFEASGGDEISDGPHKKATRDKGKNNGSQKRREKSTSARKSESDCDDEPKIQQLKPPRKSSARKKTMAKANSRGKSNSRSTESEPDRMIKKSLSEEAETKPECEDCRAVFDDIRTAVAGYLSEEDCTADALEMCRSVANAMAGKLRNFGNATDAVPEHAGPIRFSCPECRDSFDFFVDKIAAEKKRCYDESNYNYPELDTSCVQSEPLVFQITGCDPETFSRTYDEIRENFLREFSQFVDADRDRAKQLHNLQANFVHLLLNIDMALQEKLNLEKATLDMFFHVTKSTMKFKDLKMEYQKRVTELHDFSETDMYDSFGAELSMQNERLGVTSKWLKQLKKLVPWVKKAAQFLADRPKFQQATEKTLEALRLVSEIGYNIRTVERLRELHQYLNRVKRIEAGGMDSGVSQTILDMKPVLKNTMVRDMFKKAVTVSENWMFPLTKSRAALKARLLEARNETYLSRLSVISEEIDNYKKSAMLYTTTHSFDPRQKELPFYQWNVRTRPALLRDIFDGKPVVLVSEILDGGKKNSLSARDFEIRFVAGRRQGTGAQEEIDAALSGTWINLTHSGISYFKFGSRIYRRLTETVTFRHTAGESGREKVQTKLDYVLSPYTTWILRMDPDDEGKFPTEIKDKIGSIELIGSGRYVVNCADIPEVNQHFTPLNDYRRRNEK